MAISTRWHEESCGTPQVVVNGNVPECRSCGSNASALLRRAAEEPAPSYSGINLPPEAPIGQMDLWWPPCVPYTRNGVRRPRPGVSSGDAACLPLQASTLGSSLSEIYTSTLEKDHLRLLYLSGSRLIDGPIHGDLMEYPRDNCPEYETTSYTWGGEDGDATPCKPAYFGEFWDVLFVTRNCWSLLQYLRPSMGTRVVWVDAVCINQNNIPERGAQVSSMPQIYMNCMRVIIYPGDHLVRREQHRFRQRVRHDDITTGGDIDSLDDSRFDIRGSVLQGRYISRVWIIQELILAPRSVLALRDHDLDLTNNLLYCVAQKSNGRRWLEYMGQHHKLHQTKLIEALQMTSENQATDPRDRIFGILGILGGNLTYSQVVPDYSISMRDCVIGAMGLTLIISKELWPLLHIQTSDAPSNYPSWVPNLDKLAAWTDEAPPRRRRRRRSPKTLPYNPPGSIEYVPGEWATAIFLSEYTNIRASQYLKVGSEIPWYQGASIDSSSGALTLQLVRMFDKPQKITRVERDSGIDGSPVDEYRFSVEGTSAAAWFSSTKPPHRPDQPYSIFLASHFPSPSPQTKSPTKIYIVLATDANVPRTFAMAQVLPLDDVVCVSESQLSAQPSTLFWNLIDGRPESNVLNLFEALHNIRNYNAREHWIRSRERRWLDNAKKGSEAALFDLIVPGCGDAASRIQKLSLAVAQTAESDTVTEEFSRAYATCLRTSSADLNPFLDDENVWFTLADDDALSRYWNNVIKNISDLQVREKTEIAQWRPWSMLFPPWFDLQIPEIGKALFDGHDCKGTHPIRPEEPYQEVMDRRIESFNSPGYEHCTLHKDYPGYEPQGHLKLKYWLPCAMEPRALQMPVRVRMPLRSVLKAIRDTNLNRLHRYLLALGEKVSEDVESLLERGPRPEDANICIQEWPKSLVDELGFVWRRESVTFV